VACLARRRRRHDAGGGRGVYGRLNASVPPSLPCAFAKRVPLARARPSCQECVRARRRLAAVDGSRRMLLPAFGGLCLGRRGGGELACRKMVTGSCCKTLQTGTTISLSAANPFVRLAVDEAMAGLFSRSSALEADHSTSECVLPFLVLSVVVLRRCTLQ